MTANEFNQWYKPGHAVIYVDDFGKEHQTKTRSVAWTSGDGTPVILLQGLTGGYDLSRIKPMEAYTASELKGE